MKSFWFECQMLQVVPCKIDDIHNFWFWVGKKCVYERTVLIFLGENNVLKVHSHDFDGRCSNALVKYSFKNTYNSMVIEDIK